MDTFKKKFLPPAISIAIALAVGGLSARVTMNAMKSFGAAQPAGSPPSWLFPVVWSVLFVLMGVSAWLVWRSDCELRRSALAVYALSLVVNFFWPVFYFNARRYLFSFFWLILLWAIVIIMIRLFRACDKTAGALQLPYLAWLTYAGYLNLGVWLLNR